MGNNQLSALPIEILRPIIEQLDSDDLPRFRLTCKLLNQISWPLWANVKFRTIEVKLSPRRLQHLHGVANHPRLAPYVQELLISHPELYGLPTKTFQSLREKAGVIFSGLPRLPSDSWPKQVWRMIHSDYFFEFLEELLPKLFNCHSFAVCDRRFYRGPDTLLRPERLDLVALLLRAINTAEIPVKSFTWTLQRPALHPLHWRASIITKRPAVLDSSKFRAMWGSLLQDLTLDFDIEPESLPWARDLVIHAKSLKKLSLGPCQNRPRCKVIGRLVDVDWHPHLRELKLQRIIIRPGMFNGLVDSFASSLTKLAIRNVALDKESVWNQVVMDFSNKLHCLECFSLRNLTVKFYSVENDLCLMPLPNFDGSHQRPKIKLYERIKAPQFVTGISYSGSEAKAALGTVAKALKLTEYGQGGTSHDRPLSKHETPRYFCGPKDEEVNLHARVDWEYMNRNRETP